MFYRKLLNIAFFVLTFAVFTSISLISFTVFPTQLTPKIAHAQFDFIDATEGQAMRVTVLPRYPKAFEKVAVTVEDFARDINGLNISWSQGGKVVAKGVGLKSFNFTTGALGTVSDVTVSVGDVSQTIPIRPAEVDMLWQASSYTPPFYEGKALHSNQDPVTVVAEPFFLTSQGVRTNPATLIYKWKQNGTIMQEASGYGRKTFTIRPSVLSKPIEIEVEVTSTGGQYTGVGRTVISETAPKLLVYEDSPLYGLRMERALNGRSFVFENRAEATFAAIPFFFSAARANDANNLDFTWTQNSVKTAQKSNEVVFRAPSEGGGSASVRASARHKTNYLQGADAPFTIEFESAEDAAGRNGETSYLNKFLGTQTALAQNNELEYEPLVPLPGTTDNSGTISNFSEYVMAMFRFLIGAAAVLAVIMIIVGGLQYMTTDAISGKSEGKERINQAILGLLLAIGSWLILNTIDPDILTTTLDPSATQTPAPPTNAPN